MLTPRARYSALGSEIGGIQRPIYFFLQRILLRSSSDAVSHSAAPSRCQPSPSTGQKPMPRKYSSYFFHTSQQTSLTFSTYPLVLPGSLNAASAVQLERSVPCEVLQSISIQLFDIWKYVFIYIIIIYKYIYTTLII